MRLPKLGTRFEGEIPKNIEELCRLGYVQIAEVNIAFCKGRNGYSLSDRMLGCRTEFEIPYQKKDEVVQCPNCGCEYDYDDIVITLKRNKELVRVDYEKMTNKVIEQVQATGCTVKSIDGFLDKKILNVSGKEYLMFFDCFGSADLMLDNESTNTVVNIIFGNSENLKYPDSLIRFDGIKIITNGFNDEIYILRDLPSSNLIIEKLRRVSEVEAEVLKLGSQATWQAVENELTNFFLQEIQIRVIEKYRLKNLWRIYPHLSRVTVNAAGAGKADKITIPLQEYLDELLVDQFTVDAKCYSTTTVSSSTIEKVQHHLSKDGFDAKRVIVLATTNNVTCWEDVTHYKNATGQYRLLIFNARITAVIAVYFGFDNEFLEVIKECINGA